MSTLWWLFPHLLALLVGVLTFVFAAATLQQRRPTGSAAAWLLLIFLVPYLGIPLYLSLGGRKVRRRAGRKAPLPIKAEALRLVLREPILPQQDARGTAQSEIEWLTDGVTTYRAFLDEIAGARRCIRLQTCVRALRLVRKRLRSNQPRSSDCRQAEGRGRTRVSPAGSAHLARPRRHQLRQGARTSSAGEDSSAADGSESALARS